MPMALPGISVTEAQKLLQVQDKVLKSFPEVDRVFGKAGRAETATDPAPFSMMETVILLKPESEWPQGCRDGILRGRRTGFRKSFGRFWPDHKSLDELIYGTGGLDEAMNFPGVTNSWTMPIKARVDMLSTGIQNTRRHQDHGSRFTKGSGARSSISKWCLKDVPGIKECFCRTYGRRLLY